MQNERIGGLWYGAAMPEQWGEKTRNADFYDIKADVENLLKNKEVVFVKTVPVIDYVHAHFTRRVSYGNARTCCLLDKTGFQ